MVVHQGFYINFVMTLKEYCVHKETASLSIVIEGFGHSIFSVSGLAIQRYCHSQRLVGSPPIRELVDTTDITISRFPQNGMAYNYY